jgi:tRNA pseudouridine13 synthase
MKLRRLPADFQVEELTDFRAHGGSFALYRLTKRSLGTPEAIDLILRTWHLPRNRVSYGGLKDRHAITTQYVTVRNGPRKDLARPGLELAYLGQAERPFTPQEIAGNRFQIVIRDFGEEALTRARAAMAEVQNHGLPNYFDDQRMGSVGASREFIAVEWCRGNYERALWLALADPCDDDRGPEIEQKRILRAHWGDWRACKARLARSHRRSIVTYLADKPPDRPDYRGAFARLRVDLRGLYLSAFQSHVWNQMLARLLKETIWAERLFEVALKLGRVPFHRALDQAESKALEELTLPLPSARLRLDPGPERDLIEQVLAQHGLELRGMRVKYPRDSFFSKGHRAALVRPMNLACTQAADEIYAGRGKLTLTFDLPRGAYATILVKRLTEC